MKVRAGSTLACAGAAALLLTACAGGAKEDTGTAAAGGSAAPAELAPLPKVRPAQVQPLAGRWVGTAKDYFQFARDGSGVWMKSGQKLWSGQAIPTGKRDEYRFSWQGGDPQTASYWGASLTDGGAKLLFAGTNQSYTKVGQRSKTPQRTKGQGQE